MDSSFLDVDSSFLDNDSVGYHVTALIPGPYFTASSLPVVVST